MSYNYFSPFFFSGPDPATFIVSEAIEVDVDSGEISIDVSVDEEISIDVEVE